MCRECRTPTPPTRTEGQTALRLVEQCLRGLGLLGVRHVRAEGGAPKDLVYQLSADLSPIYAALVGGVEAALGENKDGVVEFSESALTAASSAFEGGLKDALLGAVGEAIQAGLQHAADQLDQPDIVYAKVDPAIVSNLQAQTINLCEATASKVKGSIQAQLLEAQRLGETMNQAMKRVRAISSLSDYEIERICRTELAKAANAARLEGYKGRVEKVRWVLGPAYRGGCGCGDLAGVYTLEEATGLQMPLHPNCDCFWQPVLSAAA